MLLQLSWWWQWLSLWQGQKLLLEGFGVPQRRPRGMNVTLWWSRQRGESCRRRRLGCVAPGGANREILDLLWRFYGALLVGKSWHPVEQERRGGGSSLGSFP